MPFFASSALLRVVLHNLLITPVPTIMMASESVHLHCHPLTATLPAQINRYSSVGRANRYICFARTQSRYLLGAQSHSFVSGFGHNPPTRPAQRDASCPLPPLACNNLNGLLNPAPNPNVLDGALVYVRPRNGRLWKAACHA